MFQNSTAVYVLCVTRCKFDLDEKICIVSLLSTCKIQHLVLLPKLDFTDEVWWLTAYSLLFQRVENKQISSQKICYWMLRKEKDECDMYTFHVLKKDFVLSKMMLYFFSINYGLI